MVRAETCSWSLCNKLYVSIPPYSCVRQVYTHPNFWKTDTLLYLQRHNPHWRSVISQKNAIVSHIPRKPQNHKCVCATQLHILGSQGDKLRMSSCKCVLRVYIWHISANRDTLRKHHVTNTMALQFAFKDITRQREENNTQNQNSPS